MMRRSWILPAMVVAIAMTLSACDPGAIDDFISGALTSNFSLSPDPAVQAAGESGRAIEDERTAAEKLNRGIANRDANLVAQAATDRPDDPRYAAHLVALQNAQGDDGWRNSLDDMMDRVRRQHPNDTDREIARRSTEVYLEAVQNQLASNPSFLGREALLSQYCGGITQSYPDDYTESNPSSVALFLALSDFSLCDR